MKTYKIIFWSTATLIFITQGLMPIATVNNEEAKLGMQHLGYPTYFGLMLAIFKLAGGLAIIIPQVPKRIKEWAFAGFAIDFVCALYSFIAVDGVTLVVLFPVIALLILALCYHSYHKMSESM
jgi:uncharacterized membrane protein YphA (DoxX/SURF4 family)